MADSATIHFDTARFNARLAAFLAASNRDAERVVFEVAAAILGDTQQGWPVDSGASRAGWWGPRRLAPLAMQIGNPFRYAAVIEYGGYPGVGEKTARFSGTRLAGGYAIGAGIFPRQKPQAPLRRALAKHHQDISKRLRVLLAQHWGR